MPAATDVVRLVLAVGIRKLKEETAGDFGAPPVRW